MPGRRLLNGRTAACLSIIIQNGLLEIFTADSVKLNAGAIAPEALTAAALGAGSDYLNNNQKVHFRGQSDPRRVQGETLTMLCCYG